MQYGGGPGQLLDTVCKQATSVVHLTSFSFEFFNEIFTDDASLLCLYHMVQKSQK